MTLRLGLLSTANINEKLVAGAHAGRGRGGRVDRVARSQPRPQAGGRAGRAARARLLRGGARGPRGGRGVHPAAQLAARRVVGEGAGGGQARALREAAVPPPGGGGARLRRGRAQRIACWPRRSCGATIRRPSGSASWRAELGELRLVRGAFSFPLAAGENVRWAPDLDGGALMDVGCYCVSGARLLLGDPQEVTAQSIGDAVDSRFVATLRFPSGALAHFDCGFDLAARDELEVVGRTGLPVPGRSLALARARDRGPRRRRRGIAGGGRSAPTPTRASSRSSRARARSEIEHPFGRDDAVAQARTIAALYEAADTGRAVAV